MDSYVEQRIEFEDMLIDIIENAIENDNIFETFANEGSHTSKHMLQDGQDPRDSAEKEFKISSYFYSKDAQTYTIERILATKLEDIVDWVFGTVDKKHTIDLEFKQPIGYAVDLNLVKYEISKASLVLTRDDTKNSRFAITTFFPKLEKDSKKLEKLPRRYKAPRLIRLFNELAQFENRPYYFASMSNGGNSISYKDATSGQNFSIYLGLNTKHPCFFEVFKDEDGNKEYQNRLSEEEFEKMQPHLYRLVKKYELDWLNVPIPKPKKEITKTTQKSKKMDILETYCNQYNIDYVQFKHINGTKYSCAVALVQEKINPTIVLDENFTDEIVECVKDQIKFNQRAGYGNFSIKVDIHNYFKDGCIYTPEQLKILFKTASKGIDTYFMENPNLRPSQMSIISNALIYNKNNPEFPINIKRIARANLTEKLMEQNLRDEIKESKNKQDKEKMNSRNNNFRRNR